MKVNLFLVRKGLIIMNHNIIVLNELNKGCCMGIDALNVILEKAEDKNFKKVVASLLKEYNKLSIAIQKIHDKFSDEEVKETSTLSKIMTWYGIQIRTITDSTTSKLSEMAMQGLNMGIIEGRKFLNHSDLDKRIISLINKYIDIQEEYVEQIKEYL